jgi:surface polysaccharide O-acyltransferase-like enzyme
VSTTRVQRALEVAYILAVVTSTLVWLIQGAYSHALWVTVALTLPWGPFGYLLLYIVGLLLVGSSTAVQALVWPLMLLLFPGMAVGNVLIARLVWRARRQRQVRREAARAR